MHFQRRKICFVICNNFSEHNEISGVHKKELGKAATQMAKAPAPDLNFKLSFGSLIFNLHSGSRQNAQPPALQ